MADALSAGAAPLARGRARAWRPRDWRYTGGRRDLRIDLLRGLAVVAMVVDHVGGDRSWLYALTGGDRFLVSAAEAFVFISGLVMGLVYARAIVRDPKYPEDGRSTWRRPAMRQWRPSPDRRPRPGLSGRSTRPTRWSSSPAGT